LINFDGSTDLGTAQCLRKLFAAFRSRVVDRPIFDFSKLHQGLPFFCEVSPTCASEVSGIVQLAGAHDIPLRTRGRGHALNGSSLPRKPELVVNTRDLTNIRHESDGTISVGAGAVLWMVDQWLRKDGLALPVVNDGYPGPSVGGYAAAGGFGPGSATAGGFWSNVAELTIVQGQGRIRRIRREAPLFPWLFGSMGQLGIIVEAKLDIVPCEAASLAFAASGSALPAKTLSEQLSSGPEPPDEAGHLFWFTLFVSEADLDAARAQLDSLERRHPSAFAFRNRYNYFIKHRGIVAPLLWPDFTSFYALGSWGVLEDITARGIQAVLAFEADFMDMALAKGYKRYVQSEVPCGPDLYERYFGPVVYSRFHALKQTQDPGNILNRNWVFAPKDPIGSGK
jgi:FAD/FMN-containing dehydrogenase